MTAVFREVLTIIDAQREAFSKEGRATDHADAGREADVPERIYVNKHAAAIPLIGVYTLTRHDDDIEYVKTEIATTAVAAQREVIEALTKAATGALTALRYLRDKDTAAWELSVTPEICNTWDDLRAALALGRDAGDDKE